MAKETTLVEYASRRERLSRGFSSAFAVLAFLGPYALCFALFFVFPLVLGIVMSMSGFDGKGMFPTSFVGFDNFVAVFTNPVLSRDFWSAVWTTFKFALVIVPLSILIPLGLALLSNMKPPLYKVFRACIYLPGIFPLTATGLILLKMFDFQSGWINAFFGLSLDWFATPTLAWFMIGLFCLWCGIGGNFIILCAGLENVPHSLYEASTVDGAGAFRRFFHVTLPGIKDQFFLCLFTTFISYMNLYGQVYILASNTPDQDAMKSAVYRIQDMLLGSSRGYGFAAAMGICLGLIIVVIAIIQLLCNKERKGGSRRAQGYAAWKASR